MGNLPAVLASYRPLLTALWVPEVFSYLWESADIRSAEDGNNEKTETRHEKSLASRLKIKV